MHDAIAVFPRLQTGLDINRDLRIGRLRSNRIPNRIGHNYIPPKASSTVANIVAVFGTIVALPYSRRERQLRPPKSATTATPFQSPFHFRQLFAKNSHRFWQLYNHCFRRLKRRLIVTKNGHYDGDYSAVAQCGRDLTYSTMVRRNTNRIWRSIINN